MKENLVYKKKRGELGLKQKKQKISPLALFNRDRVGPSNSCQLGIDRRYWPYRGVRGRQRRPARRR